MQSGYRSVVANVTSCKIYKCHAQTICSNIFHFAFFAQPFSQYKTIGCSQFGGNYLRAVIWTLGTPSGTCTDAYNEICQIGLFGMNCVVPGQFVATCFVLYSLPCLLLCFFWELLICCFFLFPSAVRTSQRSNLDVVSPQVAHLHNAPNTPQNLQVVSSSVATKWQKGNQGLKAPHVGFCNAYVMKYHCAFCSDRIFVVGGLGNSFLQPVFWGRHTLLQCKTPATCYNWRSQVLQGYSNRDLIQVGV